MMVSCQKQENMIQEEMEDKILSKYAIENGYKKIPYKEFKDKSLYYLGVHLNQKESDYLKSINTEIEYTISEIGGYIFTESEGLFYQPNIDEEVSMEQAQNMLYNRENGIGEKFLAYNKLLFNNDLSVIYYFLQNEETNIDIVFRLNYEENPFLIRKAVLDAGNSNSYKDYAINILFYNNKKRGYRKDLINHIFKNCNSFSKIHLFEGMINSLYDNYTQIDFPTKDECLIFLIECLISYDEQILGIKSNITEGKAYSYLSKFIAKDKNLLNRLKQYNLENQKIKYLIEEIVYHKSVKFLGYISDLDGYTNLRKEKSTSSDILQRIKSGGTVEVLDNTGDWYLVKTKEGKTGYIHKSRVKTSNEKPISANIDKKTSQFFIEEQEIKPSKSFIDKLLG